jgi:cyanophycin synthetase
MQSQPAEIRFDSVRALPGHVAGLRQRALICLIRLSGAEQHLRRVAAFRKAIAAHMPETPECLRLPSPMPTDPAEQLLLELGHLTGLLQIGAGIPIMDAPRVRPGFSALLPDGWSQHELLLPAFSHDAAALALSRMMELLRDFRGDGAGPDWAALLDQSFDALTAHAPSGSNTHEMMLLAAEKNIPATQRSGGAYLFGWGAHGQVFNGSLGEGTAVVAASAANDKRRTHLLLRAAGLPVAEQHPVTSLQEARTAAEEMGYPVVLKATDLEAGKGVESQIVDDAGLGRAWAHLQPMRRPLVLEKHIFGWLYRINVLNGRAVRFSIRTPAGVTGDGHHSIEDLVVQTNRDPLRSDKRFARLRPLRLTETALRCLTDQGLSPGDVPPEGKFVYLGTRTNRKDGGGNEGIDAALVHPDNARLAIRATEILRLDLSGVDLILPDIGTSWRESGGVICEVNAGPDMSYISRNVLGMLLDALPAQGRIPVDLVLGADPGTVDTLAARAIQEPGAALAVGGALHLGDDGRYDLPNIYAACHAALMSPRTTRLILLIEGADILKNGLMLERADRLFTPDTSADAAVCAALASQVCEVVSGLGPDDLAAALFPACSDP